MSDKEYIHKIALVLVDEIIKYYPKILDKKYDSCGFPNDNGVSILDRASMCLIIELMKAGVLSGVSDE